MGCFSGSEGFSRDVILQPKGLVSGCKFTTHSLEFLVVLILELLWCSRSGKNDYVDVQKDKWDDVNSHCSCQAGWVLGGSSEGKG